MGIKGEAHASYKGVVCYLAWLGAVLVCFAGLYSFAMFIVVVLLNNKRSH